MRESKCEVSIVFWGSGLRAGVGAGRMGKWMVWGCGFEGVLPLV